MIPVTRTSKSKVKVMALVAATAMVLSVLSSAPAVEAAGVTYDDQIVDVNSAAVASNAGRMNGKTETIDNKSTKVVRKLRGTAAADTTEMEEDATQRSAPTATVLEELEFWDRYLQGSAPSPGPGPGPGPAPTPNPGPTVCNGLTPQQRSRRITSEISASGVSSRNDLNNNGSSQGRALDWIINDDEAELCPDASNLVQRYIMAVFYYSTNGDQWDECSAGSAAARGEDEAVAEEPIDVVEEEPKARTNNNKNKKNNKKGGNKNKDGKAGGQDNCLKYCRDKCCKDNGGNRLCNSDSELECRADCFMETSCDWDEAKKELEKRRKDNSSRSRDRNKKKQKKKDKRKRKKSKKGGRSKSRRLQAGSQCGGPNSAFPDKTPYLSGSSECDWAGSRCTGTDITIIGFEQNNLGGTFPAEVLALNKLRNLTLEGGRTSGTIPEEWGSGVWSGDSLQVLDLDQNRLSGSISDNLFNLNTLKVLDIDENRLEGTLSDDVGKLVDLVFVEFEENNFQGRIPDSFSKLTKLRTATFRGNNFKGSMPESVCDNRVPNGLLNILTADCAGDDPKVECDCCSSCF